MKPTAICICLLTVAAAAAQVGDAPSPTPVPFTPEPRRLEWRIGFDLGNATVLEAPELNPGGDPDRAFQEAQRILHNSPLAVGLALLPFSKTDTQNQKLVNPKQWTIVDLQGKTARKSFQGLGVFMGSRMTSTEGGYHLVSVAAMPLDAFLSLRREASPQDLVFGFAGPLKGKMQVRTKLSETRWENLLPVEDAAELPAGHEKAKALLDDPRSTGQRYLYGTSIETLVQNRMVKAWLLNYSHPDTTMGTHPWGIFVEREGGLDPLYIYKPAESDDSYVAYFTASADLDQDGNGEFIVEASYRIGTAYKVISETGGRYREVFSSYYRGPVQGK
jgi:hypothetical protein